MMRILQQIYNENRSPSHCSDIFSTLVKFGGTPFKIMDRNSFESTLRFVFVIKPYTPLQL